MDTEKSKLVAQATVKSHKTELHQLSDKIWQNLELGQ